VVSFQPHLQQLSFASVYFASVGRPLPLTPVAHGAAMAQSQQPELAILIFS
tara:strand:- start:237 stop:389 length:153 start_codon:yes stop_codon:yes gene_type:complete